MNPRVCRGTTGTLGFPLPAFTGVMERLQQSQDRVTQTDVRFSCHYIGFYWFCTGRWRDTKIRPVPRSALNRLESWGGNGGCHSKTGPPDLLCQMFTDYSRPGRWVRGPLLCQRERKWLCQEKEQLKATDFPSWSMIKTESFEVITGKDVNKCGCARISPEEDLVS